MASNFIIAFIFLLTINLCLAENSFPCSKMKALDNVLFPSNVLFDRGVRSKLECVTSCSQTSGCFFLTFYGGNRCRGHSGVETSPAAGTATPGARTYMAVVNGNWGTWGSWGTCSVTCGGGSQSRTRLCDNPAPANGGANCVGSSSESLFCNTQACPVNGNWSTWGSWGTCSMGCGGGSQSRTRLCNNPAPANGGANCVGSSSESSACNTQACPWLDKPCTANSDCPTNINNVLCFEGLCNCVPGYYYSVSTRLCIAVCPQSDLQTGFTSYPKHAISGNKLQIIFNVLTLTDCQNLCLNYNNNSVICRSVDMDTSWNGCYLETVTPLDVPVSSWIVGNLYYYLQRKCA